MQQVFKTKITDMLGIDHPIPCGQIVGLIDSILPVKEVIHGMVAEAEALRCRLNRMAS